jgi:hypothetical protein
MNSVTFNRGDDGAIKTVFQILASSFGLADPNFVVLLGEMLKAEG